MSAAQNEYRKALVLAPDDSEALRNYGAFLAETGNPDALRILDGAVALDPLSADSYMYRAWALFLARRYDDGLAEERRIARDWPNRARPLLFAQSFVQLGNYSQARQWLGRADPDSPIRLAIEALIPARAGNRAEAIAAKQYLQGRYGDTQNAHYAEIDAQLGDTDRAFADLDRAWALKDNELQVIRVDPYSTRSAPIPALPRSSRRWTSRHNDTCLARAPVRFSQL